MDAVSRGDTNLTESVKTQNMSRKFQTFALAGDDDDGKLKLLPTEGHVPGFSTIAQKMVWCKTRNSRPFHAHFGGICR